MIARSSPRHAAPAQPTPRRIALPGVLLTASALAFAGLAALPSPSAVQPRVTAADALQPQAVPAPTSPSPAVAPNVALGAALADGLAAAEAGESARAAERASRQREIASAAEYVRPGLGRPTSPYGRRWGRLHAGVDLAAGTGSPVRAVTRGVVQSAQRESGYGLCVRIRHEDGTVSVYAHMSELLVEAGERVSAGERIGVEGNTGRSTGPHLHFEIRINGTPINPSTWLRKRGVTV